MGRLFGRGAKEPAQREETQLELSLRAVEGILRAIGVDPNAARMEVESGYGWNFQRGSALIEVYLTPEEQGYLQVLSPIMHLPGRQLLALYRRLLELNLQLTNAALGVHEDVVYLYHERLLAGLDAAEADAIIRRLAQYADELDDALSEEFGGRMYGRG
ncbi:MAG: YbjN domain-containing protein [Chloroflexota bacterium]|nr:YbjN domain-containing protein [Chloroflexota bacterium]MDE2946070.1 YbjN domain-containing protein [Chloroflexota bacterium]